MLVASCSCSLVAPAQSACCTLRSRPSCGTFTASMSAATSTSAFSPTQVNGASLRSSERSAFCSASVKLRPMAIASPTLFIVVVRVWSAPGELLEREPRHLDHDVVERRLEAGRRLARDVVGDLVERVADRELRGDLRDREAGGLRRERRGPRDARVHLDDDHAAVVGVDRELDVAAAGVDADLADDVDADVAQVLVLAVGEGERGSDRDRVAGVHAHRVDVLDRADDHDVVVLVAHELELVLLPAEDRLLEEHLGGRRGLQPLARDAVQVGLVVGDARAGAAHGERRPHDDRVAEVLDGREAVVHRVADHAARATLGARRRGDDLLEHLAVLAALDGLDVGADELDAVLLEDAVGVQGHGAVERGLPAEGREQGVGALLGDDLLDVLRRDRLDVGGVGELRVGHDRGRVAVDQDDPQTLLAQHAARLGARVVELAGLADDDRAGADHHDRLDVLTLRHGAPPTARRTGRRGTPRRAGRRRPRGGTAPRTPGRQGSSGPRRRRR